MIKYGLISETDGRTLEQTIDLIMSEFSNEKIKITEIGIYAGGTMKGMVGYVGNKGGTLDTTGVDNFKNGQEIIYSYYSRIIKGNSNEVYNQIADNSQHLIFVDACHCFAHVVSDFFCYAPKVKKGGYFCFHDTGKQIKPFKDFQHGDKTNPDAYISVRKALDAVGILRSNIGAGKMWEKVFDEYDELNEAGGIICFKKLN